MIMPTLKITSAQDGRRLDVILARTYPDYSRAFLQKWIREGRVTRSGKELIPHDRVRAGETIEVADPSVATPVASGHKNSTRYYFSKGKIVPGTIFGPAPTILFEDASILVINKPANLVVHPAPSHKGPTLVDWLESYLGPKVTGLFSDSSRLGVVHRLDKDTTGVLVVAKTVTAQHKISKQFQDRLIRKTYAAFVEGIPKAQKGIISAPVGRSHTTPSRMAVSSSGRASETSFEVQESFELGSPHPGLRPSLSPLRGERVGVRGDSREEVSLVNLFPKTGRTHQIRVHCAAIGHPIVGDLTYGSQPKWSKDYGIRRPLLHALRLELQHPVTRKKILFEAPWPKDMKKALALFRGGAKVIVLAVALGLASTGSRAEDAASAAPGSPKPKATHVSKGTGGTASGASAAVKSLNREIASLHDQFKSLIEEVSALQDRVTGIQSGLDQLDAAKRLRDLEKALGDLNGKTSSASNVAEESRSQALDLARKLKNQQDVLDQLRDQVDRLRQELIQAKTREETTTPRDSGTPKP